MLPVPHEIAGVRFTPFFITALIYAWSCGRCSAIVHEPGVHAGYHIGEDQVFGMVRELRHDNMMSKED